jgi:nitroimidazol reductase NimA-like FMN-containing flavoprotein (pyridoxamine 5'-phosphate oxidase superfamily)
MRRLWVGRIATCSKNRIPQVTPVGFVADENRIYLNIKPDSKKARNIRVNPRVSFVVDDFPSLEAIQGVLVSGKAELISSGKLHETGRDLIYEKYPRYKEEYGVREDGWSKYILVITPTKVRSWGL